MSPEAILKDELTRDSKMKNQEPAKSENQIVANELEKHKKRSAKSVHDNRNEIKLKGACFIATKSDLDEIDATTVVCYALICKQTFFSLQDIPISLPPVVTNLLQKYSNVFQRRCHRGYHQFMGLSTRLTLFPRHPCPIVHHTRPTLRKLKKFSAKCKNCLTKVTCVSL
jgi:hypothetical protein